MSAAGNRSEDCEAFAYLANELLVDSGVSRSGQPGRASLRVRGRVFATDHEGYLILRLPGERAAAVVAAGLARRLDPGHDSLLKEWVVLDAASTHDWLPLAREACEFVRDRNRP
jgi:hypothetical protein